jgi:anti-sigma-K factor RskA
MGHEQFEEQLPLYAIGALDKPERQAIEVHLLTGCTDCHAALKQYYGVAEAMPYGLPAVSPPAELKRRVMSSIQTPAEAPSPTTPWPAVDQLTDEWAAPPVRSSRWYSSPAFGFAMLVLLVGAGLYAYLLRSEVSQEIGQRQRLESTLREETERMEALKEQVTNQEQQVADLKTAFAERSGDTGRLKEALATSEEETAQLRKELAQGEQELSSLRKTVAQRDEMLVVLRSPNAKVISLMGSEKARSAGGLLLIDPASRRALLYAFNLPPLPRGKSYQLWAIQDKPVSAGTFTLDAGNKTRLVIKPTPDWTSVSRFAVSIEPEGGRPQPTGDIFLSTGL